MVGIVNNLMEEDNEKITEIARRGGGRTSVYLGATHQHSRGPLIQHHNSDQGSECAGAEQDEGTFRDMAEVLSTTLVKIERDNIVQASTIQEIQENLEMQYVQGQSRIQQMQVANHMQYLQGAFELQQIQMTYLLQQDLPEADQIEALQVFQKQQAQIQKDIQQNWQLLQDMQQGAILRGVNRVPDRSTEGLGTSERSEGLRSGAHRSTGSRANIIGRKFNRLLNTAPQIITKKLYARKSKFN